MVSSDLNIYDEVDSSKQDVIEQYSTRLQHSPHKWEWYPERYVSCEAPVRSRYHLVR